MISDTRLGRNEFDNWPGMATTVERTLSNLEIKSLYAFLTADRRNTFVVFAISQPTKTSHDVKVAKAFVERCFPDLERPPVRLWMEGEGPWGVAQDTINRAMSSTQEGFGCQVVYSNLHSLLRRFFWMTVDALLAENPSLNLTAQYSRGDPLPAGQVIEMRIFDGRLYVAIKAQPSIT